MTIQPGPRRPTPSVRGSLPRWRVATLTFLLAMPLFAPAAAPSTVEVMPVPAEVRLAAGRLAVTSNLAIAIRGQSDGRLDAALDRLLRRWEERTGLTFPRTPAGANLITADAAHVTLVIERSAPGAEWPALGEVEAYTLEISPTQAVLRAPTTVGIQRGFTTLLQLLASDSEGWFLPALTIRDEPRFPWRGLMIDVARHWQPMEVIKRNLDGMALVKLNVFHFHLSEDQGFRIESKRFPRLHEAGSDGNYFTQDQIREIVAYAADRGIRVVPEFDMPGHAQSWVTGYPELASAPGPYVIERGWGVFDPVLDPTLESTYAFLADFIAEMTPLFPDPYFHIGGDENNGRQWSANPRIQAFIKEHNLHDNAGLHAYFNRRVQEMLARHGKKLVGWDEILHPDLPADAVIQSWRGAEGLAAAARAGHPVILSNGYYIDLVHPTTDHYLNDPLPAGGPLTAVEQKLILGGEATMWTEWVSAETIDSRIWPRTAAIAERFWSPREVTDVDDMYRRLVLVSRRLTEAGLRHQANREPMLRRYVGDRLDAAQLAAVRELVDLVEPVRGYRRGHEQPGSTQFTPLTGLADCAVPDSATGREFARATEAVVQGVADGSTLAPAFANWRRLAADVNAAAAHAGPRGRELSALAAQLADAAALGEELVAQRAPGGLDAALARLDLAAQPQAAVTLPMVPALKLLAAAVQEEGRRGSLSPTAWREHLRTLAFPKRAQ